MKRLDLHIHTIASALDEEFEYDSEVLRQHILMNRLDIIAITNHNLFDSRNYKEICAEFPGLLILPGVEVSVENYHILVIANPQKLDTFQTACSELEDIGPEGQGVELSVFIELFGDGSYLVLPHYKKRPSIPSADLKRISPVLTALEVSSQKKWVNENKRTTKPIVMFSDIRCCEKKGYSVAKYTYAAIEEASFSALQLAFEDPSKFFITDKPDSFELSPGLYASTGLNVILGGRSTGKTYLLDGINESCDSEDVVYVEQFGIVKKADSHIFKEMLSQEATQIKDAYYKPLETVFNVVGKLQKRTEAYKDVKDYLADLMNYAETQSREDEFSKCPIYSSGTLGIETAKKEKEVVEAIIVLLENKTLSKEIKQIIGYAPLIELLRVGMLSYRKKEIRCRCIEKTNAITKEIRDHLADESRRPRCPQSPLLTVAKRNAYIQRLAILRSKTKKDKIIHEERIGKFRQISMRSQYKDATALKTAIKTTSSFANYQKMQNIDFIEQLLAAEGEPNLTRSLFAVDVTLKNERGEDVSGGQKAEYLFFRALYQAANHDIVLIDEPESSFDNPFLNTLIATELKRIAKKATVFISTHNNVLGVSIKPDGIIYTDVNEGVHRIFSGNATSKCLTSTTGEQVSRGAVLLDLMEAGENAYGERRPFYEID